MKRGGSGSKAVRIIYENTGDRTFRINRIKNHGASFPKHEFENYSLENGVDITNRDDIISRITVIQKLPGYCILQPIRMCRLRRQTGRSENKAPLGR